MKEVVQKILETEKEVRESIERAHAEAQSIVRKAEDRSRAVEEEFRLKAMAEAQRIAKRMKEEAEAERQRQIAAAQGGSAALIQKKASAIAETSERVAELILGAERKQARLL